ncbi:uncharacterized protein LOC122168486 [Centrocercus urophasianus]|uniref:uncharacterized protein LOC122168486 n=1 Tax=Centrocercus urophasianus TaxID=9002 RepID=UPI001C64C096|nr:uncharacterized protein LOC122168486 [Centrocercus urophasianus]
MSLGWEERCCCCYRYQQLGRIVNNMSTTATNDASVAATKASMATKPSSVNIYNQGLVANKQISSYDTSSSMALCSFTLGNTAITEMPAITYVNLTEQTREKICTAFCREYRYFKGKKSTTRCRVGYDYCEMKKMGFNYLAECRKDCIAAEPVCAQEMNAACILECCPTTVNGSCLKLDGKVHVNGAGQVAVSPLLLSAQHHCRQGSRKHGLLLFPYLPDFCC